MTRRGAVALCLYTLCLGACEGVDGDGNTTIGRQTYVSSAGTFEVSWIEPPWEVMDSGSHHLELRIRAELFGASLDGSPPSHGFRIEHVDATRDILDVLAGTEVDLEDVADLDTGAEDEEGEDSEGDEQESEDQDDQASALAGVDLRSPRQVALAELHRLLETGRAELSSELRTDPAGSGAVVFEVVAQPGFFVRGFYFPSSRETVRAVFVSLFELDGPDIEAMAKTIETDAVGRPGGL